MTLPPLPAPVQNVVDKLLATHDYVLPGGWLFSPNLLMAILTVFLLFLLVITFASLRHRYLDWHIKGILPGLSFGFILALILEGFLLLGGKTFLIATLGWKNAPKPISNALDAGRSELLSVLGTETRGSSEIYKEAKSLPTDELDKLKSLLCK